MSSERLFVDTFFVVALYNRRDQNHARAVAFALRLEQAAEVWTTEAVLVAIGNALSAVNRQGASAFITACYQAPGNLRVVPVDTALLLRGFRLYESRPTRTGGLRTASPLS